MHTCNKCGSVINNSGMSCISCKNEFNDTNKIIGLISDRITEMNKVSSVQVANLQPDIVGKIDIVKKQKKKKLKLSNVVLFLVIILSISLFFYRDIKINLEENRDYKNIYKYIDNGSFHIANDFIDEFLLKYGTSNKISELTNLKNDIQDEVLIINKELESDKIDKTYTEMGAPAEMSGDMVEKLFFVTDILGMDRMYISNLSKSDDFDGGKSNSFSYNGHKFRVFYTWEGELLYIKNSFDEKVYENGQSVLDINSFVLTREEVIYLKEVFESVIRVVHEDPLYAEFSDININQDLWDMHKALNIYTIISTVNSKDDSGQYYSGEYKIIFELIENNSPQILEIYLNDIKIR